MFCAVECKAAVAEALGCNVPHSALLSLCMSREYIYCLEEKHEMYLCFTHIEAVAAPSTGAKGQFSLVMRLHCCVCVFMCVC